jgi:hypothetical protein
LTKDALGHILGDFWAVFHKSIWPPCLERS